MGFASLYPSYDSTSSTCRKSFSRKFKLQRAHLRRDSTRVLRCRLRYAPRHRRLEPASIAGPLRRDMRRCRSRQPRQTLPQPRRRSAADHQRHSIGRRLGQFRGDLGARRPAGADAGRVFDAREFQDHHSARRPPTRCRTAISPQKCCSMACRRGRTFSIACGSTISASSGIAGETQVGHFRTAPTARSNRFRSSGRAIRRGRAGASIPRAAACGPTGPCSTTVRTSSSIPAITSMRTARWSGN